MPDPVVQPTRGHVLLLEPNASLRAAVLTILSAEHYQTEAIDSLDEVLARASSTERSVALVAWQSMEGLLAEEHRHHLAELCRRLRLVVMVPRRWARLLEVTDLPATVTALISKPFEADELIETLEAALARPIAPHALAADGRTGWLAHPG
jgi:DNA-binding response OmpR family regulator